MNSEETKTAMNAGAVRANIERDITEYIRLKLKEFYEETGLRAYGLELPAEGMPTAARLLIK
ncbi:MULTISPECIES: hypothetical protein [unclassified Erwinia]|uniref:hypothetical protein n=1 Tax=unclassified Erwinia TaxID=2622719 RepID=UPI000C182A73|nr:MULTISPECIES: hypothetical protein [unclassified Erwinia]PIJ49188.1 hypothetical protein BV501_13760 [Erwinia sp. OAMSP11]PIJ79905.1 hypothetical protein BLD47_12590 [Erwinia sp. OLCASP19]PIJ81073.1 hypothetical protein BLD46_13400 [Erwinia sp. OLMTSP26]PIJ93129.1 hypothetical protein BL249_05245 [Erwinia sp. OLFS4]